MWCANKEKTIESDSLVGERLSGVQEVVPAYLGPQGMLLLEQEGSG